MFGMTKPWTMVTEAISILISLVHRCFLYIPLPHAHFPAGAFFHFQKPYALRHQFGKSCAQAEHAFLMSFVIPSFAIHTQNCAKGFEDNLPIR